jgi:hypothetical protein
VHILDSKEKCKSWFCTLWHPEELFQGTPEEMVKQAADKWCDEGHVTRGVGVSLCFTAAEGPHMHLVLEDSNMSRFSAVQAAYPTIHIEPTKGNKKQAVGYLLKQGEYESKEEQVIAHIIRGEIQGRQGKRNDLDEIEELIELGLTPTEIIMKQFSYRRYSGMIKQAYYDKRKSETPFVRDMKVVYHVGESGSGKSYTSSKIVEAQGEDAIYMLTDYERGGFDSYNGQPILFMDEYRGQLRYAILLQVLDVYKVEIGSRYNNTAALWTEVHITSVYPPEMLYDKMVKEHQSIDTLRQFLRRINTIVYHYKQSGTYFAYEMDGEEYENYEELKRQALYGKQTTMDLPF